MIKFAVHKGKTGLDFTTLADTAEGAMDLAWVMAEMQRAQDRHAVSIGPFKWWKKQTEQWGQDKWYVRELNITDAVKEKSNDASDD